MAWVDVKNTQQNSATGYGGGAAMGNGATIYGDGAPWWMLGAIAVFALWVWKGKR